MLNKNILTEENSSDYYKHFFNKLTNNLNKIDSYDHSKINEYESGLMEYLSANNQNTLDAIASSGKIDDKTEKDLKTALDNYSGTFNN